MKAAALVIICILTLCVPTAAADPSPVAPDDFVALSEVDASILQEIRYFTPHNFTGDPVDGYLAPLCILTREAAQALARAQRDFIEDGYTLKVYDCYRPQRAVDEFVSWAKDLVDQRMKAEFYPRVEKSNLFADGYIAERSGHSRGSTVDLTLVPLSEAATVPPTYTPGQFLIDCAAPQAIRFPDNSLDMGTGFDCFDTLANTADPRISGAQAKNRTLLLEGLQRYGFVNYDKEWWHFTYRPVDLGEPFPDTIFDFPVDPAALSASLRQTR
jgi:D-alanyl-D-alanine dipeptidase